MDDLGDFIAFDTFFGGGGRGSGWRSCGGGYNNGCGNGCGWTVLILLLLFLLFEIYMIYFTD
jgi:hypothetical protein